MLLIPIYQRAKLKRLPIVIPLIIALNLAVYFILQYPQRHTMDAAEDFYLNSNLWQIELPLYMDYLAKERGYSQATAIKTKMHDSRKIRQHIYWKMRADPNFYNKVLTDHLLSSHHPKYQKWKALSQEYFNLLNRDPTWHYGFKTGDVQLLDAVLSLFMHANIWHLLANMFFLVVLGLGLELTLGSLAFFCVYSFAGLSGLWFQYLFASSSLIPVIGASAAVCGIMAMFAMLYASKKITFFYNVLLHVGYLRAPAIIILAAWFAWEIIAYNLYPSEHIAYLTHLGGVIMGLSLGILAKVILAIEPENVFAEVANDPQYEQDYQYALKLVAELEFDKAYPLLMDLHQRKLDDKRILNLIYNIKKCDVPIDQESRVFK